MKVCLAETQYLASYHDYLVACFTSGLTKYCRASREPKRYLEDIIAHDKGNRLPNQMP